MTDKKRMDAQGRRIIKLTEEIIELREEIQSLHNECKYLHKLYSQFQDIVEGEDK
jgi:predicted RNase H-like nuclease (RuvC/YqgF family)